jgi:hypothetical protein
VDAEVVGSRCVYGAQQDKLGEYEGATCGCTLIFFDFFLPLICSKG